MNLDYLRPPQLEDYRRRFVSRDLDETRHYIANAICPHNLSLLGGSKGLDARIGQTGFGDISFLYIQHGAAVSVNPGRLETVFLLQIPVGEAGHQVAVDGAAIRIAENMAYIVSPRQKLEMRFAEKCGHIVMTVGKDSLSRHLERTLQHSLPSPLEFDPEITFSPDRGHELINLVLPLIQQLRSADSCLWQPEVRAQAIQMVMSTMIFGLRHNFSEELHSDAAIPRPRFVKWAQEYVLANARSRLTPDEIARAACVSRRSLYSGFRAYLQCTPMAYVRDVKLDCVREELIAGDPVVDSVSRIAAQYNIHHFSNFAANYKRKFGELPSRTLRSR